MDAKKVIIEKHLRVDELTLLPITEIHLSCRKSTQGISFFSTVHPVGIIFSDGVQKTALRVNGEEVSLDQIIREVPDIKERLDNL
jgi:hypothetical protein